MTRADIQAKINQLQGISPLVMEAEAQVTIDAPVEDNLRTKFSAWLDTQDLAEEGMSQEFIKQRLLEDFNSYENTGDK